jgi:cellulase
MRFDVLGLLALASSAYAHSTFQQLWVDGVDQDTTCARLPINNNPIGTNDAAMRCGNGNSNAAKVCNVKAGGTVTVEMHAQPGDRKCSNEAIGGNHDGPVIVYMSKVNNALSDAGSSWFKIFQNGLVKTDYWGTDALNANCGKQDVKIPSDIVPGDYLIRAEVIALHVAGNAGGAQHYVTCWQVKVSGSGNALPSGVSFPGAYKSTDPGILFNVYGSYTSYTVPGPAVYTGGGASAPPQTSSPDPTTTQTQQPTQTPAGNIQKYQQCGGNGWSGSGTCAAGLTCNKQNDYYSQCL